MPPRGIYEDELYPYYDLEAGVPGNLSSGDRIADFTDDELADIASVHTEFRRIQDLLRSKYENGSREFIREAKPNG